LSPLEELDDLQVLNARCNRSLDLSPLKNLSDLRRLDLAFCEKLTEIPALYDLTKLERFFYSPKSVDEGEIHKLDQHLPDCDVYALVSEEDMNDIHDDDGHNDDCGFGHHR